MQAVAPNTGSAERQAAGPSKARIARMTALRLITCTGSFDRATHNYSDHLVVTAYAA